MLARILLPPLLSLSFALPVLAQVQQPEWKEPEKVPESKEPEWIQDATTGCRVWNLVPEPNEAITWSGPCVNGMAQGIGVLQWLKDGSPNGRYEGEYNDGKRTGQGTYMWPDGSKYVGAFHDDKRNGPGTFTSPNGTTYVGQFLDNKLHGKGTYSWPNGTTYVGKFLDGKRTGQGTLTWPDGAKYVGDFDDGKLSGQGTLTQHDGTTYVGTFRDGQFNGQGTLTSPNGDTFIGEFRDGVKTRNGTFTRRATALCRAVKTCEVFAKVRQQCADAGDYDICVNIKMKDRDYSGCSASGGFTSGVPKDMPNSIERAFSTFFDR